MLPRKYRITKNKEFEAVFKNGKYFSTKYLFARVLPNNLEFDRFGFIVSLKVSKKAHERAKIKRRLRESAAKLLRASAKNSLDFVIIAKKSALEVDFQNLNREMEYIFRKSLKFYSNEKDSNRDYKNLSKDNFFRP